MEKGSGQALERINFSQPLDLVWSSFAFGLDDIPEQLETLANKLPGTDDPGLGEKACALDEPLRTFRQKPGL
mgnify:CR=1 FL=1